MDGAQPRHALRGPIEELAERFAACGDPRLAAALLASVDHVFQVVDVLKPTQGELRAVIDFLTEVGQSCDSRRQDWVLFADAIGLSQAIETLNAPRPEGATPNTLAGPFYREDAPDLPDGANLSRDGVGAALAVTGIVRDLDGRGVPGALVEVWQANGEGLYENQVPDRQPEHNLRGRLRAGADGAFRFRTVRPKGFFLPEDGPVGRLMNRLGRRLERPAHLHFRISAEGFDTLTTHVFDRDDPAIERDALFGVRPELLAAFRPADPAAGEAEAWALDLSFILAPRSGADRNPETGRLG
jgi:protocatechuate 3,4-dioxygenase beta subunit